MEGKNNIFARIQAYIDTEKGRILLNYLYSWGAAIVILGALFKLTHIPGANLMLFIGMGTEVIVFFISGFEKPFIPDQAKETGADSDDETEVEVSGGKVYGNIYINGNAAQGGVAAPISGGTVQPAAFSPASQLDVDGVESTTQNYIDRIQELTEKLLKISEQSDLLQHSTAELETLGRNLVSLNKFYEMHLRSASSQMDNIDNVKSQTAEMVSKMEELNRIYARMVEALKVNSTIGSSAR